jgi:hypothetical protein
MLLAQGLIQQYRRVLGGGIVRQDDRALASSLQVAQRRLGRMYIEEGKRDQAASVHEILARCRAPLDHPEWDLEAFQAESFPYRGVTLLDPDLRVPTVDCAEIAQAPGGFGEDQIIEDGLHRQLRDAAARLGPRKNQAYTAIREVLGRRSLISEAELIAWVHKHELGPVQRVFEEFYEPVLEVWLIDGMAFRCGHCGTLLRPHPNKSEYPEGRCPLHPCALKRPVATEKLDPRESPLLIARPQILAYWTAPSVDEIRIYDAAMALGLDATLYPESDASDVGVNGWEIGIDVKSYTSPVTLGMALSRGIGGLIHFRKRILAVSDDRLQQYRGYLDVLRAHLPKQGDASTLRVMSVSSVLSLLQRGGDASSI